MIVIMIEWCRTFTWQLDKLGEIRHSPTFKSCFFKFVDLLSAEDALQASRAASLRKGKLVRARLIVDCDGLGIENMRYLSILKKIITLGKSYYPEVAATVTVIRAPGFSAFFYNLLKPLLPKLLQEKIWLLGRDFREGLMKHTGLDAKSLPDFLGGEITDVEFAKVQPVPSNALDYLSQPEFQSWLCFTRTAWNIRCRFHVCRSQWDRLRALAKPLESKDWVMWNSRNRYKMIRLDTNSPMRATGFNLHSSNSTALP